METLWFQSLSVKIKYPHFQHCYHIVLTIIIGLAGVNGPWLGPEF